MPYTAQQLSTFYQGLTGTAPDQATQVLFQAYAQQNANSSLSDAQTLALVFNAPQVQATFEVAVSTYQFFTGTTLSGPGLQFLRGDAGAGNTNGLNSAFYSQFNTENRYYNFAINLATQGGAGAASFAATYGTTSITPTTAGGLSPFIQAVYETVIGSSNVGTTAANSAIADITSRLAFFQNIAATRGGDATALSNPNGSLVLKAVIAGYILEEANKADVGTYAKAIDQFEASVAAGNAIFGPNQNLIANYSQGGAGFGTGVGANTSGTGGQNGGGSGTQLTPNVETLSGTVFNGGLFFNAPSGTFLQTLNTGDVLNGTGTAGAVLNVSLNGNGAFGANTVTPQLNNISTINIANLTATGGGAQTLDLSGSSKVGSINVQQATTALNLLNDAGAVGSLNVANLGNNLVTITSVPGATAGTTDVLALTSGANPSGANNVTIEGYETINLNATGLTNPLTGVNNAPASTANTTNVTDASLTTLNVQGSVAVSLGGFTGGAATTLTTINAGAIAAVAGTTVGQPVFANGLTVGAFAVNSTSNAQTGIITAPVATNSSVGGLTINASGLGASVLNFTGGNGNDTLVLAAGLTAADTINGGAGTDTLGLVAADNPGAALNITNVETIRFYAPTLSAVPALGVGATIATTNVFTADTVVNAANFGTAVTTIELGANNSDTNSFTGSLTVKNLAANATVAYDFDPATETVDGTGTVTGVGGNTTYTALTTSLATNTAADVLVLNLRDTDAASTFTATATLTTLNTTNYESVNLNFTGGTGIARTGSAANLNNDTFAITNFVDPQLSGLRITGGVNVTLASTISNPLSNLATVDASSTTGNITLGTLGATPGVNPNTAFITVNTGAAIQTGSGNDVIVLDVGGTAIVNALTLGGQTNGVTATTPGTTTPVITDFGDVLALTNSAIAGATATGVTIVDLSSTTDQIAQLLSSPNSAIQTGIDSIDLSGLSNAAVTNTAIITGNANANYIVATTGVDTLNAGAGNDVITGGNGGDSINVGAGTDTLRFVAATDSTNNTGTVAAPVQGTGIAVATGAFTNFFDKVVGIGGGDRADFTFFGGGNDTTTINVGATFATDTGRGAAASNALVRGIYNPTAQTFTADAAGNDLLFQHDTSAAAGDGGIVDVVLIGSAATVTSVTGTAGGIFTFAGTTT